MELYKKIYTSKEFLKIETILQHGFKNYKREYLLYKKNPRGGISSRGCLYAEGVNPTQLSQLSMVVVVVRLELIRRDRDVDLYRRL